MNINGRMKVKTLKAEFKSEFGLSLRVYDGRSFADDNSTLASIRKGDNKGDNFSPQKNTKVGNLEDKIVDMFGSKVQISGSDDSYLCDNDLTLAAAVEVDKKKMVKKSKNNQKINASEDLTTNIDAKDSSAQEDENDVRTFANSLFKKSNIDIEFKENDYDIAIRACKAIQENVDEIEGIGESDCEKLTEEFEALLKKATIENVWQIALLSRTLEEEFIDNFSFPEVDDILNQCKDQGVLQWSDAIPLLTKGLGEINTTDEASDKDIEQATNFAVGCFFLAIESCAYVGQDDFDADDAEEGIKAWVTGYGNCFEYDEPVGGVIDEIDSYGIKDGIMDSFIGLLNLYYCVDVNDHQDDDETTNWEQVAEEVNSGML